MNEPHKITNKSKLGLTFGIGYRIFGKNGWYLGTSLFGGRYFTDEEKSIIGAGAAEGKSIVDIKILNIGKIF